MPISIAFWACLSIRLQSGRAPQEARHLKIIYRRFAKQRLRPTNIRIIRWRNSSISSVCRGICPEIRCSIQHLRCRTWNSKSLGQTGLNCSRQTSACRFLNLICHCTSRKTLVNCTASLNTVPICLREKRFKNGRDFLRHLPKTPLLIRDWN